MTDKVQKIKEFLIGMSGAACCDAKTKKNIETIILPFVDSLQEEPVSEELEEACEQLAENARKHKAETSSPFFSPTDYRQGVIDGAKWQKEQQSYEWKIGSKHAEGKLKELLEKNYGNN